jgi:hypothetical protein
LCFFIYSWERRERERRGEQREQRVADRRAEEVYMPVLNGNGPVYVIKLAWAGCGKREGVGVVW